MTIRTRLWLFVGAAIGLVLLGNAAVVFYLETGEIRESFKRENLVFASLAGPQALRAYGESGRRDDDPALEEKLSQIAKGLPQLKAFALLSPRGKTLASFPRGVELPGPGDTGEGEARTVYFGGEEALLLTVPTHGPKEGPPVNLMLIISTAQVKERIQSLAAAYGVSLGLLLFLGGFLSYYLAGLLLKPLSALRLAAIRLKEGELESRVAVDAKGELGELAQVFNDMAERLERNDAALKAKNAALTDAYQELQTLHEELSNLEKMAAVGRTTAAVSHEIDNPIGIILGTAVMLKKEAGANRELYEDLELIEAESLRLRRIVRDLLDFARPGADGHGPADVGKALSLVLKGLGHHPELRGVEFSVSSMDEMPLAEADEDGVKQVLLNLLLNAAKAVSGKGVVEVAAGFDASFVEVSVLDRGTGIPPENLERIFMPHFGTGKGAGLGLSISKRLVEGAGGRLYAENRQGGGAVFTARWPRESSLD